MPLQLESVTYLEIFRMILRSPSPPPAATTDVVSAWKVIARTQQQVFQGTVDLVTQPSHAALAGEIAAKIKPEIFGPLSADALRAIAMHDSGWGPPDAQQIMRLREASGKPGSKAAQSVSFLAASPKESITAWKASIETALQSSALGAYLVSAHFSRLAESIGGAPHREFIAAERSRQEQLQKKLVMPFADLDRMVEALQFCDELSLYLCCGAHENVSFSQAGGIELRREGNECVFHPAIFAGPQTFQFAVLHMVHGKKTAGGAEIDVTLR